MKEKEKVYEVVSIYDTLTSLCTFTNENAAKGFIEKYLAGNKDYFVQPREKEKVYTSLADMELSKEKEVAGMEFQIASLKIELPFYIESQSIAKSHFISFKSAKEMKVVKIDNENVSITLPNGYNFITSYENFQFIRRKVAELEVVKTTLEKKISKIKKMLAQNKYTSVGNENEDEMK